MLKVKFAKEEIFIIEIKKMQLAGDKESPLLYRGLNLKRGRLKWGTLCRADERPPSAPNPLPGKQE